MENIFGASDCQLELPNFSVSALYSHLPHALASVHSVWLRLSLFLILHGIEGEILHRTNEEYCQRVVLLGILSGPPSIRQHCERNLMDLSNFE